MVEELKRIPKAVLLGLASMAVLWLTSLLLNHFLAPRSASMAGASPLEVPDECAVTLVQRIAARDVAAEVVFVADGTLRVSVPYPLSPGASPDEGAQAVWTVFDAVSELLPACPFLQLEVTVRTGIGQGVEAEVAAEDLAAWKDGALGDDDLIDRVTYIQQSLTPSSP